MRFGLLGLVAVLLASLAACGSDSTTPAPTADAIELPADNVLHGLRHVMTKDGVRSGVLISDTAYLYETGRKLDLRSVRLNFYDESGRESGTLTSETGEYDLSTGEFIARGNVVLITEGETGERQLETEELHYDVERDQLRSDVPFVLKENGSVKRGTSFRSDGRFRNWEVTGARTEGGIQADNSDLSF